MHLINLNSYGLVLFLLRRRLVAAFGPLDSGQGPSTIESNASNVLALGPTLESLASVYAFDAEASEGPGGA